MCRETGLDCDFIIKGETMEEFLESGANHAIEKHGMRSEDVNVNDVPANLLCHTLTEETND